MAVKKRMLSLLLCTVLHCVFVPLGVAFAAAVDSPATFDELNDAILNGTSTSNITVSNEGGTRTITLNADVNIEANGIFITNQTVILNMNGHTIEGTESYVLGVDVNASVTVRGDGCITGGTSTTTVINVYGTFNLESGTIHAKANRGISLSSSGKAMIGKDAIVKADGSNTYGRAVNVGKGCSLTTAGKIDSRCIGIFASGSVEIKGGTVHGYQYGVYANGSNVTDCSVKQEGGIIDAKYYGIYATNGANVTQEGGEINSNYYGIYANKSDNVTLSGGSITVTGNIVNSSQFGVYSNSGDVRLTGSSIELSGSITVNSNNADAYQFGVYSSGDSVTLSGGSVAVTGSITVTDGVAITDKAFNAYQGGIYSARGDVALSGGGVELSGSIKVGVRAKKNDKKATASQLAVHSSNGSVTLSRGSVKVSGSVDLSGTFASSDSVEAADDRVTAFQIGVDSSASHVTVEGGSIDLGGSRIDTGTAIVKTGRYGVYTVSILDKNKNLTPANSTVSSGTITGGEYGVYIYRGGTHEVRGGTIEGHFGISIWGFNYPDGREPYGKTVLNISDGTITSDYHAISGNARRDGGYTRGSTIINISGGDIRCTKDGVGIYHPQDGELNITGGSISGPTGIEMRGGSLNMEDGSVTGTAETLSGKKSGDGNTTTGAGIAVSQHPENYAINVDISGGTITGYTSFYENHFGNIYDRVGPDRKPVNLKITGGQFVSTGDASVISMHNTGFISGGSYSYGVDKDYLGTLTWDEAKAFSPAKEQPIGFTGAFSCIKGKVKSNNLPYHVGYLTGYPTPMITMHVGEKRPPFVPTYKLSKVDIEKVIGNAIVNVDANTDPDDLDGHITVTYQKKGDGSFVDTYEESLEPAIASWASGAPTVATVNPIGMDEPGVVTAKSVSPSPVNITATLFNGEQVDFFVTVAPTVTFNMNGHGAQVAPQTVANGGKAVKPADPSEAGWAFDGWYEDAAITKKFDFSTAITNDITLHAKWVKHCTVTFNMNGHGAQVAPQTVANGGKAARPADPVAGGYAFSGWYKDAALTTAFDFGTAIHADMTLYAKWANIPQTGDNTPLFLWIALLIVSCGGIAGTLAFHKEKNH